MNIFFLGAIQPIDPSAKKSYFRLNSPQQAVVAAGGIFI
jgi:hypothetical protein